MSEIESTKDSAVMIDLSVRTGTANVMQQRQWGRFMYSGKGMCECTHSLDPDGFISDDAEYSMVCLTTDNPVVVTFIEKEGNSIVTLSTKKCFMIDSPISNLVVRNATNTVANVRITKLR